MNTSARGPGHGALRPSPGRKRSFRPRDAHLPNANSPMTTPIDTFTDDERRATTREELDAWALYHRSDWERLVAYADALPEGIHPDARAEVEQRRDAAQARYLECARRRALLDAPVSGFALNHTALNTRTLG